MVTNINFTLCSAAAQGYNDGIAYTLAQFNLPNVVMYVYAGNAGWLGWVANIGKRFSSLVVYTIEPLLHAVYQRFQHQSIRHSEFFLNISRAWA